MLTNDKIVLKKPEFFFEKKAFGNMARFKKIENPMLKKTKLAMLDIANFMAFAAIVAYCMFSTIGSGYIIKTTYDVTHELFHVEP